MRRKYITKMQWGGNNWQSQLPLPQIPQTWGPNYAQQFAQNTQPMLDRMKMQVGFATQNSSDPMVALKGRQMLDETIGSTQFNSQETPDISHLTGGLDWSQAISSVASSLPGEAGKIANTGTSIYRSVQNLKDLRNATNAAKEAGTVLQGAGKVKAGNIAAIGGAVADLAGSFLPEKQEYAGPKGDITQTMDSVYNGISDAAMSLGPVGMLVGGIMKGGAMLGKGVNALGGGTDGMTTTDAILGSSFLNLTPIGLINGFGGSKTNTITKDNEAFETVGSSYTGSNQTVDEALTKSGKKYGLFSSRARNEANREIEEAKRQQATIADIADNATNRFAIRNSMAAINGNRRAFNMQGGYDQAAVRVGRSGLKISPQQARQIVKSNTIQFQQGGKTVDPFEVYLNSLPENQRDSTNFRVRDYWEFNGKPKNFDEAQQKGMFELVEDFDELGNSLGQSWHAHSVAENPDTGELEFMKSSSHPSHQLEIDWYNSDNGAEFRSQYELQKTEPYWKYVKRKTISRKQGGTLNCLPSEIELVSIEEIEEFQQGGSINIIPDGALHARKHNMDLDGITPKGIPVVSEKEGGELEQQAEIEKEEIIFRLEVTKKLEELMEEFYDEDSSQSKKDEVALEAGKLLTEEILHNTIDNTKSLL